jgi:hypothetical protein
MRNRIRGLLLTALAAAAVTGCRGVQTSRPYQAPPPADVKVTHIDYVDADGFDALLESALVNQDPAIVIATGRDKPDWGPRLNAWIAAWNRGGKVDGRTTRLQAPTLPGVNVDADTLRELRQLIDDLMDRVEESAKAGSAWWTEERTRARRVALLKPYNLRFHMDEDGLIEIALFNGRYAAYHADFVRALQGGLDDGDGTWVRGYKCSCSKHCDRQHDGRTQGKLMSGTTE